MFQIPPIGKNCIQPDQLNEQGTDTTDTNRKMDTDIVSFENLNIFFNRKLSLKGNYII